jgi:hypothetical protein
MKPDFEDLLERDQVYRAGYLAGAADALLDAYGESFDECDGMQTRKSWRKGYEQGFKDHDCDGGWRIPEWE